MTAALAVALILTVVLQGSLAVLAAPPPPPSRSLAVSVPPEPTQVAKGATANIPIRVLNPGDQPVTITITPQQVLLGNNGQVNMAANADPQWQQRVHFAPDTATIPAQQFVDVTVTVDVPTTITSDLHFVGFLVTPVATAGGQVIVINQIGSFVTVDVPGPRTNQVQVTLQMPGFKLGSQATGTLKIANIGGSSVRFWGESNTTSSPGAISNQQRLDKTLLPIGATTTVKISAEPAWPVGFVTIHGRIVYPSTTESTTTEIQFSKRVLIIDPRAIAILAGLLLAMLGWWLRRRRRRPSPQPEPEPASALVGAGLEL